ncbi:MerR family transcriptional regulator [uncultured Clostridium sp.]|uniref:MerR family transcriptional regulator n=1 Tax=uncultured Clostridium sp. TaxID=59620 RepID=UPI0025DF2210|nr:MerR family transcriptional regulator [uncultured Clostridium sp.]
MDKFRKYYSTGEFAELCGVNKKTLFHYDDIDLLKPEKITSNGYRYYSSAQLEIFSVITILKDLEMPLKEIKCFIKSRTPQNTIELFNKERIIVEQKINHLKRVQKLLDVKLNIINEAHKSHTDVILEEHEEETIVLSGIVKDTDEEYDVKTFSDHVKYCFNNNLSYGYPTGSIVKKEKLINGLLLIEDNYLKYDYYFTKVPNLKAFSRYDKKPAGTYASIYHHGYYDTLYKSYQALLDFIAYNNLIIDSDAYEEILIDEVVTKSPEDFVFKISIKVRD